MPQLLLPPGFILLNKSANITSHACIRTIKRLLPTQAKIGHGGALDPLAKGLLLIGIDRKATTHLSTGLVWPKTYTVRVKMGTQTDTLDKDGEPLKNTTPPIISQRELEQVASSLIGTIKQTPPVFSALKHNGKALCRYARDGDLSQEELEKIALEKTRSVQIYTLEAKVLDYPFFEFTAHVSKGTYVRSLAQSILKKLDTIGTVHAIYRTKMGPFTIQQAINIEQLKSPAIMKSLMLPLPFFLNTVRTFTSEETNIQIIDNCSPET